MDSTCKIAETGLIGMLHEMNNPLTSIKLCVELLEGSDQESSQQYHEIIIKNVALLESAIRQISNSFIDEEFTVHLNIKNELLREL